MERWYVAPCGLLPCVASAFLTWGCAVTAVQPALAPSAAPAAAVAKPATGHTRAELLARPRVVKSSTPVLPMPEGGPSSLEVDIGEHCLEYRYSEQSHCPDAVQQADCQDATSEEDCGIPTSFALSSTSCRQIKGGELQEWHVFCGGYIASGPLPTPQCPDDHVLGDWGQDCEGSCVRHCGDHCPGGYCTGGGYNTCYVEYDPYCDCGVVTCPCTGPDCP